ncbi:MAG: hypothetical protein Q4P06_08415 [Actinomycetaceae bacterium]|nr:hypothetical protein [Actinomycetaceae bacterium]
MWDDAKVNEKEAASSPTNPISQPSTTSTVGDPSWRARQLSRRRRTEPSSGITVTRRARAVNRLLSVPLNYLSATTVILLAAGMTALYLSTQIRDVVTVTVIIAIIVLANGWSGLVHSPTRYAPALTILVVGIGSTIAVRATGDLAWATVAVGVAVVVAALAEMARPLPREDLVRSISASVTGALVAILGSAWVGLSSSPVWSIVMVGTALIVICAVVGNQFGTRVRARAVGAVLGGVVGSGLVAGLAMVLKPHASLINLLTPFNDPASPLLSLTIASLAMGFAIGGVIAFVDIIFGERIRRCTEAGAFARGAMKFLLVVMPIYILVRLGAF